MTIGIDIGTTSVKAVAADDEGKVVAQARVPHAVKSPEPDLLEHDAAAAWYHGPREALRALGDVGADAVAIAAMVPSTAAVDGDGVPTTPGLLYGDRRGRGDRTKSELNPAASGEVLQMLKWSASQRPEARGYWPAQAVAAVALGGPPVVDLGIAAAYYPLFTGTGWDAEQAEKYGAKPEQLPEFVMTGEPAGKVGGLTLAAGSVDAMGEQIVAGCDDVGDALVICGTTLITWAVIDSYREAPHIWTIPWHLPGKFAIGGPSNAGGLFLNWAKSLLGPPAAPLDPHRVPVWSPYVRGERTPIHDPDRRAVVDGLDLTMDAASLRRGAYEAAGFVVRHHLDLAEVRPRRIVATGGGVRDDEWVQALADCTGVPVDCVAVPEGAALGMAWVARMAAGHETQIGDAARWARTGRRVDPDNAWIAPVAERYARFREMAGN
ncbi:MAG: FGGY-family carbohydrate kinase [Actinomycetes bacterium]